ncbi:MAG: phosphoribosylglycinamide synthetase C domain-containing protein, partial [Pseudomonadota bacterium]
GDFGKAKVFHAGTTDQDGNVVTSGGRVLCVVASGDSVRAAQTGAYAAMKGIHWQGEQHRTDIGYRAVQREEK